MKQWVEEETRIALVNGRAQKSLIDHCYHSDMALFTKPEVHWAGDSDHDTVVTSKVIRSTLHHPECIKKRIYKHFR